MNWKNFSRLDRVKDLKKSTVETPSEALKPSGMLENWINIA